MPKTANGKTGKSKPLKVPAAPMKTGPRVPPKFTYALKQWTAERREAGWFVAVTVPSFDNRQDWDGPFETVETACLAIARGLAAELASRHTRQIEHHKIPRDHGLHGLKPTTKL